MVKGLHLVFHGVGGRLELSRLPPAVFTDCIEVCTAAAGAWVAHLPDMCRRCSEVAAADQEDHLK